MTNGTTETTADGAPANTIARRVLIAFLATYLIAVTGLALYALIELWPHPTPAGEVPPPTDTTATTKTDSAKKDTAKTDTVKTDTTKTDTTKSETKPPTTTVNLKIPFPTDEDIEARKKRFCGDDKKCEGCRTCIAREMQLQYESQRRFDPECVQIFGCHVILWQEKRLLLLVLLAGAVGALLQRIRYLAFFVGKGEFKSSWTAYYLLSPLAGATIAFVAYAMIRGGFFSSSTTTSDANPIMFVALGALSGLFTQQFLKKLEKVAETVFEPADEKSPSSMETGPVIASLDPGKVAINTAATVKVNGSGFNKDSKVQAAGTAMTTTFVSVKQLTFELPATSTATAGTIKVVVVNANGARSEAKIDVV